MDTKREDGGQAFPIIDVQIDGQAIGSAGMSLRDWFAGQALAGLLASNHEIPSSKAAEWSYDIANNMLKERAK